jgi:hypothetical protein
MKKMKKISQHIVMLLAFVVLFESCEKATLNLFDSEPSVYFRWLENDGRAEAFRYVEEVKFMFIPENRNTDTVRIPVFVMGPLVDHDRPFRITTVDEEFDRRAREGVHYQILHELSYIPANSREGFATVLAMRATEQADKAEAFLHIRLAPNEHFQTNFPTVINNTTQRRERSTIDFYIVISDVLTRPWIWQNPHTVGFWGDYSERKYRLILDERVGGGLCARFWERLIPFEGRWVGPGDAEPVAFRLRDTLQRNYCRSQQYMEEPLIRDEFGRMLTDVVGFWSTFPRQADGITLDCSWVTPRDPQNAKRNEETILIVPIEEINATR